jgi:hypothetical protein
MTGPIRIQRKRSKGYKMPPDTVSVTRPGNWGNPFNFTPPDNCWNALALGCRGDRNGRQEASVKAFRQWVCNPGGRIAEMDFGVVIEANGKTLSIGPRAKAGMAPSIDEIKTQLRGKNLACWCSLDQPCHADVLLEIANEKVILT